MIENYFSYNPDSGDIFWIKSTNFRITPGLKAGSPNSHGYLQIKFNKKLYKAHRLAWYLHYGEWPKGQIDHINRDKLDNRIENLRDVSPRENCQNKNKEFQYGAVYRPHAKKWISQINIDYKTVHLGYFNSKEEAQQAYKQKVLELNG